MIRYLLPLCVLFLPLATQARGPDDCRHSEPRRLELDTDGVGTVVFEVGHNRLRLDARAGAAGSIQGRACASSEDWLEQLKVEQRREGDRLHVRLYRDRRVRGIFLGSNYAYLDMSGTVPDGVQVQLSVGSGDAWLTGASAMSAEVGSGDLEVRRIAGRATVSVGSGDIGLEDVGTLHVRAIGSGDVEAARVRGDLEVGSIGAGDLEVQDVGGNASIRSIGSGDASLSDVAGNASIGSIGSGDARLRGVGGDLTVDSIGSGDLEVRGVGGRLTVTSKGSGSIRHADVAGGVDLPRRR